MRKTLSTLAIAWALLLGLTTANANAAVLAIADANYVGSINDGIPSNPADEVDYINTLIARPVNSGDFLVGTETYNREGSVLVGLPTAVLTGSTKDETGTTSIDATGYQYVLGKYDAGKAGSLVWYFDGGATGTIELPATYNGQGLSHISLYNQVSVPDGGMTLMLLGSALVGLGALRRKFSA